MSSSERPRSISDEHGRLLLDVASASIEHGALVGRSIEVTIGEYPAELQARRASFVTLNRDERLIGCIGSLEARRSLVDDVARNAFAAAFRDPRSPGLKLAEVRELQIHISVLGVPERMQFVDEDDLVAQLRPGVDGLIFEAGFNRGTFLPVVWASLSEPREFLAQLKLKAGLPPSYWSHTVRVWRYTTESIP